MLKKVYKLELPSNYVDIDKEEMEYISDSSLVGNSVISYSVIATLRSVPGFSILNSMNNRCCFPVNIKEWDFIKFIGINVKGN